MPKKNKIFLHIGMHKTGSTSIQHSLKTYDDGTTRYARLGRPNHSFAINQAFHSLPGDATPAARSDRAAARAALQEELTGPARNLILSGESIPRLQQDELQDLRDMLYAHAEHVEVIAYLRDPYGFAVSSFQQKIKTGTATTSELILPAPHYRALFEPVIGLFGAEHMQFVPFSTNAFRDRCLITDFCDRVGIPAEQVPKLNRNQSLSGGLVSLLMQFNERPQTRVPPPEERLVRIQALHRIAQALPGKMVLHPDLVTPFLDPQDQLWMEQTAGFSLARKPDDKVPAVRSLEELHQQGADLLPKLRTYARDQGIGLSDDASANDLLQALLTAPRPGGGQKKGKAGADRTARQQEA